MLITLFGNYNRVCMTYILENVGYFIFNTFRNILKREISQVFIKMLRKVIIYHKIRAA